ncbi:cysteine synthase A [Clostridium baratii]|uniref:Cysteine synthase n=1 Tax=Clostridium nitritogenes TaxID=83340 RepID=A0ABP3WSG0_9CLOT|nr:cysteine synthase A [Clostridium baratii]AQM61122.1 cysteine synthase A [Clostridium baratii]KJU71186.1 cysteine synthase [Clostridium baratii]MBT9832230.1 cysteine synthase A [Clostridium baratii]MDY3207368.1 cysteine synthase A [Clostridium baratii]OPF50830.1 cysteine synthase A [Clostridium baratii]
MIYESVLELIGNTPMLKLKKEDENSADIYVKLEKFNATGSVKDRAALGMIEKAEKDNLIKPGDTIVEPTSGNTGIALAMIGKLKGYKVIIVMPETMSEERRALIKAYGAELILTDGKKGMKGAIAKAEELSKQPGYFIPSQFDNEANKEKHYETTAEEILKDVPDVDVFIAGVGTGGTVTGVSKKLKERLKNVRTIAAEPEKSKVLSGGKPGPHSIQGIGAGFIPSIYESEVIDEVFAVTDEDAFKEAKEFAAKEGLLVGISTGCALSVAKNIAKEIGKDKKIVLIAPDGGEKYISMGLYD